MKLPLLFFPVFFAVFLSCKKDNAEPAHTCGNPVTYRDAKGTFYGKAYVIDTNKDTHNHGNIAIKFISPDKLHYEIIDTSDFFSNWRLMDGGDPEVQDSVKVVNVSSLLSGCSFIWHKMEYHCNQDSLKWIEVSRNNCSGSGVRKTFEGKRID